MDSDQGVPPALTEYEGTVPTLFRRAASQLAVLRDPNQAYYLYIQLKTVRSEAAIRWRNQFNESDAEQVSLDEEGCGSGGLIDGVCETRESECGTGSFSALEKKTSSSGNMKDDTEEQTGFDRVIQLKLDNSSELHKRFLEVKPWLNQYQKQKKVFVKNKRRVRVIYPLRRSDGYMSLVKIPSSTVMASSENSVEPNKTSSNEWLDFSDVDEQKNVQHDRSGRVGHFSVHQHLRNPAARSEDSSQRSSAATSATNEAQPSLEDIFIGEEVHGYTFIKRLADGASSVIFLVENEGETFVAKVSIYPCSETDKRFKILSHEYNVMKELHHPQIVKVYEYFVHCNYGVIIMEYMERGELWSYVEDNWPLHPNELQQILHDVAMAVRHICTKGFTHMDIKTNNILMDSQGRVKLADFGGARKFGRFRKRHRFNFFTPEFSPPEKQQEEGSGIGMNSHYKHFDIWSFGVVCYQLYTGKLPYTLSKGQHFISRDSFVEPVHFPDETDTNSHLSSLIRECMRIKPSRRITPKEALFHPYFCTVSSPEPHCTKLS